MWRETRAGGKEEIRKAAAGGNESRIPMTRISDGNAKYPATGAKKNRSAGWPRDCGDSPLFCFMSRDRAQSPPRSLNPFPYDRRPDPIPSVTAPGRP